MLNKTKVLWFTGLSGSGKSTIAELLVKELSNEHKTHIILDGDDVRNRLHKHLGFTKEDILENNRLIIELCKQEFGKLDYIIVPVISPFKISRDNARKEFKESFIEIFVDCPYEICRSRDVKGLYKKAHAGEIKDFIGLHHLYENPQNPEIRLDTASKNIAECFHELLVFLNSSNN